MIYLVGTQTMETKIHQGVVEYLKSRKYPVSIGIITEEIISKGIRTSRNQVSRYMPIWLEKPKTFAKGYELKATIGEPKEYWLEKIKPANEHKERKSREGLEKKL